jgi:nitrate/TMAO reductase-like tetraheme cytochrome c subunit
MMEGPSSGLIPDAMKYVAACCVVTVVGLFAFVAHESRMLSYMSSDPKICINCHTMNTHYATWQHSSHRDSATCAVREAKASARVKTAGRALAGL